MITATVRMYADGADEVHTFGTVREVFRFLKDSNEAGLERMYTSVNDAGELWFDYGWFGIMVLGASLEEILGAALS